MDSMEELLAELTNSSSPASDCDLNATLALHSSWIYNYFGDCVVEVRQYFAFLIGLLSIVCWIFAQFPQIVVNCRTGTADKSLSFWFLLLWVFSDSANFVGAILANQLITQVVVAAYYVFIDLVTLVQFCLHYFTNKRKREANKPKYGSVMKAATTINVLGVALLLLPGVLYLTVPASPSPYYHGMHQWSRRTLLQEDEKIINPSDWKFITGYALGCFSAVVYFFALPPQIIKNFMRCSVSGLSLLMFVFVTLGDFTYLFSVLLFSVEKVFIIRTLPWILGSAWSLFFDIFLLIQIIVYKCLDHARSKELAILSKETTV